MQAVEHGARHEVAVEQYRARRIVVSGRRKADAFGVAVAVHDGEDGDAQFDGFLPRDVFLVRIDDEHEVRQAAHFADTAERALELVSLARQVEQFLFREAGCAGVELFVELAQQADGVRYRAPIGEHAAEPAVVYVVLAAALRRFGDGRLRLPLGADEQHAPAAGDGGAHRVERPVEQRRGLLQVDDMDSVANAVEIRLHLRVPAVGLVPEMHAGFQQLAHVEGGGCHVGYGAPVGPRARGRRMPRGIPRRYALCKPSISRTSRTPGTDLSAARAAGEARYAPSRAISTSPVSPNGATTVMRA